ncbi:MAG: hypothetical protein HOV97_06040 [Nonomuraea sp.]|nr:hypothetical protein [Nonomuraea sp.]
MTGGSTTTPELRVYRNGAMVDATGNANADTSESAGIALAVGDQVRAEWSSCSVGAAMLLTMEGSG